MESLNFKRKKWKLDKRQSLIFTILGLKQLLEMGSASMVPLVNLSIWGADLEFHLFSHNP